MRLINTHIGGQMTTLMELVGRERKLATDIEGAHGGEATGELLGTVRTLRQCADQLDALVGQWEKKWSRLADGHAEYSFITFLARRDILGTVSKEP